MSARLVVAIILLLVLGAGLWWTASLAPSGDAGEWEGAVFVVLPSAEVWNGTVSSEATPLAALQEFALERGFGVAVEQQAWIGPGCTAAYVRGIAGHAESSTGGWNYYVRHPAGPWEWQAAGAACPGSLHDGDQLEWCWVESDVCRHHAA